MSLRNSLMPKGKSPQPEPPETEPIVGYRCWKLVPLVEGVFLYSVVQDFCWLPFEPASGNVDDPDSPPNHGGIYAFKSPNDVHTYFEQGHIAGSVNLWGTVVEHSEGYRAEFAYPKEFLVPEDFDPAMILHLEQTYGVPAVIKPNLPKTPPPPPPMSFTARGPIQQVMEIVRDVIYDREALCGRRLHLFYRPIGMSAQNARGEQIMKSWERTNMVQAGTLQAPWRFVIKAIRCVFFEADGRPIPITDPIYWETTLDLLVDMKTYWRSPVAHVADPAILLGATDWSKIPVAERLDLIRCVSAPLTTSLTPIPGTGSSVAVDGVAIEQQQFFDVQIDGQREWLDREVLVALEGVAGRPVF